MFSEAPCCKKGDIGMDEIRDKNAEGEILDIYTPQHQRTGRSVRRGEPLEGDDRLLVAMFAFSTGKTRCSVSCAPPPKATTAAAGI